MGNSSSPSRAPDIADSSEPSVRKKVQFYCRVELFWKELEIVLVGLDPRQFLQ